jgi:tripartite-type tricarboxylate transporter receptor subunit TctC
MNRLRRRLLRHLGTGLAGSWLAGAAGQVLAQTPPNWPTRPVKLIYPYPPGGSGDILLRSLTESLYKLWNVPIVADNRAGAGGMIGAEAVARAEPDGYTLLMGITALVLSPQMLEKPPFHPLRDLTPITLLGRIEAVLAVHSSLPVKDLKGFVDYVNGLGTPFPYGSVGLGTSGHLGMEVFGRKAKIRLTHVPYKGEGPLLQDMIAGQVSAGIVAAANARKYAEAGKIRVLATVGRSRSALLPEVPTFTESGYLGLDRSTWSGIFAPASTPRAIVEKVGADINQVLTQTELRTRMLENFGWALKGGTPAEFAEIVRSDYEYWGDAIRAANLRGTG